MLLPPRVLASTSRLLLGAVLALVSWDAASHLGAVSVRDLVYAGQAGRSVAGGDDRWTAALVFTPVECPGLMAVVDRLNELAGPHLTVRGFLLVDEDAFPGWQKLVHANQIRFPVRAIAVDRGTRALSRIGILSTPAVAIFDPRRRLRLATDLTGEVALATLIERTIQPSSRDTPSAGSEP